MAKRRTKNTTANNLPIVTGNPVAEDSYVTWGNDVKSRKAAMKASNGALEEYHAIPRATGYVADFSNLSDGVSGRPGLTKSHYYSFRPSEAVPTAIKDIIGEADLIYQRVGLVKNVIDLMGDFASQGVRVVHENKRIERFYKSWFKKIQGKDRSERFLNNLYRTANIVMLRQTAKINNKTIDTMYRASADADLINPDYTQTKINKKEIPWKYTFVDPKYVDPMGGSLAAFTQQKIYGINLPKPLKNSINSPKNDEQKKIITQLPPELVEAAKANSLYKLDPDKTLVFHYKKDDWQIWAYPMIYAVMDDIKILEKLKLADMCALDGATSHIRIFKIGNLQHKIAPTKVAANKLTSILAGNVGAGSIDLVWGPDIELLESNTDGHAFLGEEKYRPHLNSVYAGLGIPPTLTGAFGAAGTTNNFISLKTLTQRLQYGRDVLVAFWEKELEIVQKAMGFAKPAKIEFDRMDLSNEDAEKALLIQLADRNIISNELLQIKFGMEPTIESARLNRENKDREIEKQAPKYGPYYNANFEDELKKIALNMGIVSPSEVGLELEEKKKGEKIGLELKKDFTPAPKIGTKKPGGVSGQGRPKTSKDTKKRKEKRFAPQTGASLALWANDTQDRISEIINPIYLDFSKKDNLRKLSAKEASELSALKTKILLNIEPNTKIDENGVISVMNGIDTEKTALAMSGLNFWINKTAGELNKTLTSDEIKILTSAYYAALKNTNK